MFNSKYEKFALSSISNKLVRAIPKLQESVKYDAHRWLKLYPQAYIAGIPKFVEVSKGFRGVYKISTNGKCEAITLTFIKLFPNRKLYRFIPKRKIIHYKVRF